MALTEAARSVDSALIVKTVESLADTQAELRNGQYAALILDLALVDSQGLSNVSLVKSAFPALPILVVSGNDTVPIPARVAALGAKGFLSKSAPIAEMKSAISVVLEGGSYFPNVDDTGAVEPGFVEQLSPAQTRVTVELVRGSSNKVIAHELGLSEATVKSHLSAIFRILGVSNRSQAILALKQSSASAF